MQRKHHPYTENGKQAHTKKLFLQVTRGREGDRVFGRHYGKEGKGNNFLPLLYNMFGNKTQ